MGQNLPMKTPSRKLHRLSIIIAIVPVLFVPPLYAQQKDKMTPVQNLKATSSASIIENARDDQVTHMPPEIDPTPISQMNNGTQPDDALKNSQSVNRSNQSERLLHPLIVRVAKRYKVDSDLVKAIIMAESNFNNKATSKKGARGLMQLMPGTAKLLGVRDIFNPEQNIDGGVKHFKNLLVQFEGDVTLALAAYNAGSIKVRKYNGVPPYKATRYYIKKVFEYYEYYGNKY
jgi:soluble lytic murein transglycosylase-like protein